MFSILDAANGGFSSSRPRTAADRACDQCKSRKVRCAVQEPKSQKPCLTCAAKGVTCTYDKARKKRGPVGKRIEEIRLHQKGLATAGERQGPLHSPTASSDPRVSAAPAVRNAASEDHRERTPTWPLSPSPPSVVEASPGTHAEMDYTQQRSRQSAQHPEDRGSSEQPLRESSYEDLMANTSTFQVASLPNASPAPTGNPFVAIRELDLPPLTAAADIWPVKVNETTLLPWIDVYFTRLHPTIPILNRTSIYSNMLLRKHRTDPQYGAMLLGLCAFAMTQPVQTHEHASLTSRIEQGRLLLDECVKMRVSADFGENPTVEMVLTSFFLFACLFGSSQHKAARHRLREAVDLAHSLGLHLPDSYVGLSSEVKEQWLRTYLVLSVTERAYALQRYHPISFRGQPGITVRFMQAFDPLVTSEYISSLIYQDQSDSVGMTGLLYLMDTLDAINESVMDCWNGFCRYSDGNCEDFDRRKAMQMFRAQRRVREASISGNISFAPSVTPLPLAQLFESQQADISVTQFWTLNRLWTLCLSHQLLREQSDHCELRVDFACHVAHAALRYCETLELASMEIHGVGFISKMFDMAMGVIVAMNTSASIHLDSAISPIDGDAIPSTLDSTGSEFTVRALLKGLHNLICRDFRGGDHVYNARLAAALEGLERG